ncbi:DUF4340 domain-containing protein, partial [Candidatus Marithioploca araucensis]|nr:DUF4340 domain-containing protein [Candidatus Marithioploca araucensis]
MRQRWLLNIILLGVTLLLSVSVFYTIEQEKPIELPQLTDLKAEQVQNIHIERKDNKPIFLKKDKFGWQMTTPYLLPASRFRATQLLDILSTRNYKELKIDKLNLAKVKLEPPLLSVKFDTLTMAYGDRSPIDGRRYILINQKKVYLFADTLYDILNGDALAYVNLSPFGNNSKITELKMPDYLMVLKEGQWALTSSFSSDEIDKSPDALNTLIDNWQRLQGFRVEPYVEGAIQGKIDIRLLNQEKMLHFTFRASQKEFVLGRPEKGVQYQIPTSQVDKLLHLPTKTES